jgi:tetratricopeptide (TPR) repeat protein
MIHSRVVITLPLIALSMAGCQSTGPAVSKHADGARPASDPSVEQQRADPGSNYRKAQLAHAMRGLKYENETVTIDEPVAATIAQRGTRDEALAVARAAQEALDLNDQHAAIAGFTKAIIIDPTYAPFYRDLGVAVSQRSKRDEATAAFRKALELDPQNVPARLDLAEMLDRANRHNESIAELNSVLAIDANNAEAHGRLALAYYFAEDDAAAWTHTHIAEQLGYEFPSPFRGLLSQRTPEPGSN